MRAFWGCALLGVFYWEVTHSSACLFGNEVILCLVTVVFGVFVWCVLTGGSHLIDWEVTYCSACLFRNEPN